MHEIDRPPRIQPELPSGEFEIPNLPEQRDPGRARLLQIGLPLLTIVGYVLVAAISGSNRNPLLLLPMGLSVIASVVVSSYSYRQERKQRLAEEKAYANRLVELTREMSASHDLLRRFYYHNYPGPDQLPALIRGARRQADRTRLAGPQAPPNGQSMSPRSEATRLWERRTSDDDFGVVRLGVGTLPSTVTYVFNQEKATTTTPLGRAAAKLAADSCYVADIPVILSLRQRREQSELDGERDDAQYPQTPFAHALGIAGERNAVYSFARALLSHFMVFHSPTDARLYVLAVNPDMWSWIDYAPHSREDEQSRYRCFVSQVEIVDETLSDEQDGDELTQFLEGLRKTLSQRQIRLQARDEERAPTDPTQPFLLVVVDLLDQDTLSEDRRKEIETDAAMAILQDAGASLGAAVIFLVDKRTRVPGGCRAVIEVEHTIPTTNLGDAPLQRLHFRYAEAGLNRPHYVGVADTIALPDPDAEQDPMNSLAQQLTDLKIRQSSGAGLPSSVSFIELMTGSSLSSLQDLVERAEGRWKWSRQPQHSTWLQVKLGRMSGDKDRKLYFSAQRDGVHGIVAGSTGSGKSELLISLITGLALNYDPTVLNFVLVDFKGGVTFEPFKKLPHCVDVITNLAGDGVTRMFTAINAELERRQRLNKVKGRDDIVKFRKDGFHDNEKHRYPFLFIIIDEFAEMIADRAEYRGELEKITRIGRSLGVSLILAAQRPSGVTDQMRSNIKFRICLRVETPAESRELLRRSDAAYLPSGVPGRGYLQVGNEEVDQIQIAYAGDRYADQSSLPVIWPERGRAGAPPVYIAVRDALRDLAQRQNVPTQVSPWPKPLPARFGLNKELYVERTPLTESRQEAMFVDSVQSVGIQEEPITSPIYLHNDHIIKLGQTYEGILSLNPFVEQWLTKATGWSDKLDWEHYALRPVIGLIDNPARLRHEPLAVKLPEGHVAMFGASGWGKTNFVRTLIISLAATHSPGQVHIYILDLGGRLGALKELPHVGAVITPDVGGYEERVEQLIRKLADIVEERKQLLGNLPDVGDIYQYNKGRPKPLPAFVVAIDNFVDFNETFGAEDDSGDSLLNRFVSLVRQSRPYGVHFVISASRPSDVPNSLFGLLTKRLTLRLADDADYRTVVGSDVPGISDIRGRGYVVDDEGRLVSFQLALPFEERGTRTEETSEFARFTQRIKVYATGREYALPFPVDALPRQLLLKEMLVEEYKEHKLTLDATFVERLRDVTARRWTESAKPANADWLRVVIGERSGRRAWELRLDADHDGNHGLIAGGTGSGKSELLMTLIVELALNYDPSVLNFVLVDYKGGGAFEPFRKLPHCVDVVTNLNKAAVKRMFTAIDAEIRRRQRFQTDIIEYRRLGRKDPDSPYPHLVIIIDEYAEMITNNPEFRDQLDSIARVGRSLGINLILASQRPTGVSDQMRANIKLRICLRVQDAETSRELLRRPDAAHLPSGMPGRGYVQVETTQIDLVQVAWTGETINGLGTLNSGDVGLSEDQKRAVPHKFYELAVELANSLIKDRRPEERPRRPWPLPLEKLTMDWPEDGRPDQPNLPLELRYLHKDAGTLLRLRRHERTKINPFVRDWLEGHCDGWPGVTWGETALHAVIGLVDDPAQASEPQASLHPLEVDFTRGHAVVFGAAGWGKTTFLRSLIVSLACTHAPDELHVHILDLGKRNFDVLAKLPHVGTIIPPDERGYEERIQQLWRKLNEEIDNRNRKFGKAGVDTIIDYNRNPRNTKLPAILVAIDNVAEFIETFGGAKQDDPDGPLAAFVGLARQGKAFGIHVIITATRLNVLSSKLYSLFTERYALRLSDSSEYSAIVGGNVVEPDALAGRGYTRRGRAPLAFQVALLPEVRDADGQEISERDRISAIGDQMKALIERRGFIYQQKPLQINALPASKSYSELLGETLKYYSEIFGETLELRQGEPFLDQLKQTMQKLWALNATDKHADWLRVVPGVIAGDLPRQLHLAATSDGVHGLIAGGTGSGKSELLTTLILGLALAYPPEILNFVLVDYKGGGAFKPFERLPHCVDLVTNLDESAVDRMFASIDAEIKRRQSLNASTSTENIVVYRKDNLHAKDNPLSKGPYPHLVVIIDEYAEMIDANSDYLPRLESITRVGRAQGVHLILASQQPKGVTDQMRANIKLRICLRVEQPETSNELLRRPDAARLPRGIPGRGYLQGGNENIELIQIAWAGERQPDTRPDPVEWPDPERADQPSRRDGEHPRLYESVVQIALDLAGGHVAKRPWPGFLPRRFSLESALYDVQKNKPFVLQPIVSDWISGEARAWPYGSERIAESLRPVVGLKDDPAKAYQGPLTFDLLSNHLVVLGDAGTGKTTLLQTLLLSLAATHTPAALHVYVLDLGGRNFDAMSGLPHVGDVLSADDETFEERLQRLLDRLNAIADERQRMWASQGVGGLDKFNQRVKDRERALPAIIVLIDNFAELQENYERLVETDLLPLVRRGLSVGITFVAAANLPSNFHGKLYSLFSRRLTFKQTNIDRYLDIVGRGAVEIGDIPGRCYIREDGRALLCHIAQPTGFLREGSDHSTSIPETGEHDLMKVIGAHMDAAATMLGAEQPRAEKVAALPTLVPLERIIKAAGPAGSRVLAVVGQNNALRPALGDLKQLGPHFAVIGPPRSGKTTALYSWVLSLADRYTPTQIRFVLIDLQRKFAYYGGERTLADLPHVLDTISESDLFGKLLEQLNAEGERLKKEQLQPVHTTTNQPDQALVVVIDNFDDFCDEIRPMVSAFTAMVRRYDPYGLHMIISGTPDSTNSENRRRILSPGYGIGLQTVQALSPLRVHRLPVGMQDRELVVGRGYLVKSGQAKVMQVASPYEFFESSESTGVITDDIWRRRKSLDNWVRRVCDRYPHKHQRATWSEDVSTSAVLVAEPNQQQQLARMQMLLQRGMNVAAARFGNSDGTDDLFVRYATLDVDGWSDEKKLLEILKELQRRIDKKPVKHSLLASIYEDNVSLNTETVIANLEAMLGTDSST